MPLKCVVDTCLCDNKAGNAHGCCAGGNLSFVFTNIDPSDYARQFSFGVKVHNGKQYAGKNCWQTDRLSWHMVNAEFYDSLCHAVTACEPPVTGLDGLLESLNRGNLQFSAFVHSIRRQFQHLC